jgi:hypothetical protein
MWVKVQNSRINLDHVGEISGPDPKGVISVHVDGRVRDYSGDSAKAILEASDYLMADPEATTPHWKNPYFA